MNSFPYPLNKFGTLTTVLAHIAFLGTVPFQALYPLPASTNPTESQTITASHIPISLTNPPNTQSREGDLLNAATDVHLASSNDLTVTAAIQTNTVDAGGTGHIVSRRHVSDEHLARGTFISTSQHKAVGDHAFHWGTTTPEAVPALLTPTESATEASSTAAPPSSSFLPGDDLPLRLTNRQERDKLLSNHPATARLAAPDTLFLVHPVAPGQELLETAAGTLRMLAEPTRLRLLWQLSYGSKTVTELTAGVGTSRTVASQHLARLRLSGLVMARKEGRHVIYSLHDGHLVRLIRETIRHADHRITGEPTHD